MSMAGTSSEQQMAERRLMPPPQARPPQKRRKVVVEEEEYQEKLEAIIRRDYFPNLNKMENQVEWLEAVNSGDPELIRNAQLSIQRRQAGLYTPLRSGRAGATPARATPTPGFEQETPVRGAAGGETPATPGPGAAVGLASGGVRAPAMSLDQYVAKHHTEDDASFAEILEEDNRRRLAKSQERFGKPEALPAPEGREAAATDEYGTSGQTPMTLEHAQVALRSALYFDSSQMGAAQYTTQELQQRAAGAPKEINAAGTRLGRSGEAAGSVGDSPFPDTPSSAGGPPTPAADAAAVGAAAGHGTAGYSYVSTPSVVPGEGATPLMTWGDIASTPLRLEAEPGQQDDGRGFAFQDESVREQMAKQLSRRSGTHARTASRRAASRTPLLAMLQRQVGGRTPGGVGLSPAGRRLASSVRQGGTPSAGKGSTDMQLRAAYSRTPLASSGRGTPASSATPSRRTPLLGKRASAKPAAAAGSGSEPAGAERHVTDDLLKL